MKTRTIFFAVVFYNTLTFAQTTFLVPKINEESFPISPNIHQLLGEDGTLKIEGTGSIKVFSNSSLTVKDAITNLGDGTNFTIQSDANLIQINNASANTGNLISEREFKIGTARNQYNYVGSPVAFSSGQSFKTIFPGSTNTMVLYHNQTSNTFSTSSGANIPGRGLAVKEPPFTTEVTDGKTTALFKGVAQNGTIKIAIANKDINSTTYGYNLLGNPYPSNIDLNKLFILNGGKDQSNISASFYLWDNNANDIFVQQGNSYQGQAYAIYNALAGSTGTGNAAVGFRNTQVSAPKIPSNILKVGQGFMTKSLRTAYDFQFDNSIRTQQIPPVDFLGKGIVEDDRYWLKMTAPSGITSTLAVVHYAGGNNGFGPEDSVSLGGSDALYSIVGNEKLAIDGRNIMTLDDVIFLGSHHFVNDNYTLELAAAEGIFANGQNIYLKDTETGKITNLNQSNYIFTAVAGESSQRFEIIYKAAAILAVEDQENQEIFVYRDSDDFVVQAKVHKIEEIDVYDSTGKLIFKNTPHSRKFNLPTHDLPRGIYLFKIRQGTKITTKKVLR